MTHADIANLFHVSRITISRLMIRQRFTDSINNRPRSGRSIDTSQRQKQTICLLHLRNRTSKQKIRPAEYLVITTTEFWARQFVESLELRAYGLKSRRILKRPLFKQRHRISVLQVATDMLQLS